MTTTAQTIIREAQELLSDLAGTHWPATELIAHLNDGQRAVAELRPDLLHKSAALALTAGPKQSLPADCLKLIEIPRNTNGAALRQVDRNVLDAVAPSWYSMTGTTALKHFCHDPREPGAFYVYPPAANGASVELVYSAAPVDVAAPGGAAYSTVTGNLGTPDVSKNALLHFVLFRAYAKDAEAAGNAALSAAHYALFKQLLIDEATTRQAVKPTIKDGAS